MMKGDRPDRVNNHLNKTEEALISPTQNLVREFVITKRSETDEALFDKLVVQLPSMADAKIWLDVDEVRLFQRGNRY